MKVIYENKVKASGIAVEEFKDAASSPQASIS